MICPRCDIHMDDEDDLGDGNCGYECPICHYQHALIDEPCPKGDGIEPCLYVDGPYGQLQCLMCEEPERHI